MAEILTVLGIDCQVIRKKIKNIHLNVHPPNGTVSVSAPLEIENKVLELFLISKISWIKKQQRSFAEQPRETPREFVDRESHYLWGQRYLLKVIEEDVPPSLILKHHTLHLTVRPNTPLERKQEIFAQWYRDQLRASALVLIEKWEGILNVITHACGR